jgi:hypothetical protein
MESLQIFIKNPGHWNGRDVLAMGRLGFAEAGFGIDEKREFRRRWFRLIPPTGQAHDARHVP